MPFSRQRPHGTHCCIPGARPHANNSAVTPSIGPACGHRRAAHNAAFHRSRRARRAATLVACAAATTIISLPASARRYGRRYGTRHSSHATTKALAQPLHGAWGWTTGSNTYLRARPSANVPPVAKVPRHTKMFVWGKFDGWYRVQTPDGKFGWVFHDYLNVHDNRGLTEMSRVRARIASDRTGDQKMYGTPTLLKKHLARYGSVGAAKGLRQLGVRVALAPVKRKPSAKRPASPAVRLVSTRSTVPVKRAAPASSKQTSRLVKVAPRTTASQHRAAKATGNRLAALSQNDGVSRTDSPRVAVRSRVTQRASHSAWRERSDSTQAAVSTPSTLFPDTSSLAPSRPERRVTPHTATIARPKMSHAKASIRTKTAPAKRVPAKRVPVKSAPIKIVKPARTVVAMAPRLGNQETQAVSPMTRQSRPVPVLPVMRPSVAPPVPLKAPAPTKAPAKARPAAKPTAKAKPRPSWRALARAKRVQQAQQRAKWRLARKQTQRARLRQSMGAAATMVPPMSLPSVPPISPDELLRARDQHLREKPAETTAPEANRTGRAPETVFRGRYAAFVPGQSAFSTFDDWASRSIEAAPEASAPVAAPQTRASAKEVPSLAKGTPFRGGSPRDYARFWANRSASGVSRTLNQKQAENQQFVRDAFGKGVATQALSYRGMPYIRGAASPNRGFDCSGLVFYLLRARGLNPPRTAAGFASYGSRVNKGALKSGDLVLFANTYKRGVSHIGVYMGEGKFVHAATSGTGVRVDSLNSAYYQGKFYGARRVAPGQAVMAQHKAVRVRTPSKKRYKWRKRRYS